MVVPCVTRLGKLEDALPTMPSATKTTLPDYKLSELGAKRTPFEGLLHETSASRQDVWP